MHLQESRVEIFQPVRKSHESHSDMFRAQGRLIVFNLDKIKDIGLYKCHAEIDENSKNANAYLITKILSKFRQKRIFVVGLKVF